MILSGEIEQAQEAAQHFIHEHGWMEKAVDALVSTWNATPLTWRWSMGMILVLSIALGKFLLPGIAQIVAATHSAVREHRERRAAKKKEEE